MFLLISRSNKWIFHFAEVMAEDVLDAYIVEDREEEIKQNCRSAMRIQQEILNMLQAEGLAEPAMPPVASKALILEVNLNNSLHGVFTKVSNFQITNLYPNTQISFYFKGYAIFGLGVDSRRQQLDTSVRDGPDST